MTEVLPKLRFQRKPSPVLAEHRPLYKIFQILLVLHIASRGGRSRLIRLHLFNWALKSPERCKQLEDAAKAKRLQMTAWGFDPALAIAVRFAIAEGLIQEVSTGYELTDSGSILAKSVVKDLNVLAEDVASLQAIGKGISEAMVEEVAKGWEAS